MMDVATIVLRVVLMVTATVLLMILIGVFSRRLLDTRVSSGRIVLAGVLGLGAGLGFESQFVWKTEEYVPAMIPVMFGIIFLVAIATLVIAELLVPQGSLPRPDQWLPSAGRAIERNRRYMELLRIMARNRLLSIKLGDGGGDFASGDFASGAQSSSERLRQARAVKLALEEAGGAFIKLGQLLSTRPDVLPAEFIEVLGTLQQQVPPAEWIEVEAALDHALGRPHAEVFASFEPTPFAAASIGQVHAAVLPSGQRVAVKVRRPGIVPMIERDIDIAERLVRRLVRTSDRAAQFGMEQLVDSLTASLREELDYGLEAANIAALAAVQDQLPAEARLHIPSYVSALSSESVLVMEHVSGATLSESGSVQALGHEERHLLAKRLLAATLAQIMEAGVFHSDLHPGNIIIADDGSLVLLDFGSIGRIDSATRARLGEVLFAFSKRDSAAFTDALMEFVDLGDGQDERGLRRAVSAFMSRRLGPGSRLDPSMFAEVVGILAEFGITVPAELTVPFRTIATVEGSLRILDPEFDFVAEAGSYARLRIDEAKKPLSVAKAFGDELLAALPMVKRLPYRIDRITGNLADGRLGINVRMLADARDRGFLREVIGLAVVTFLAGIFGIMAAMLLTSATGPQLTDTLTLFQIFGYLFLVVSGVLTLRALFDVLRRRSTRSR